MALEIPPGVEADGAVLVAFVPEIADPSAPTLAEVTAPAVVKLTCYITDNNFKPTADDATGEDRRLCSKQVFSTLGTTTWSFDNTVYVYDPQNPESESNKAYAAMKRGVDGFFVVRWGKDVEENPDFVAGDIVDVFPITCGTQVKEPPEQNSKLKVSQKFIPRGNVVEDYKLAPAA